MDSNKFINTKNIQTLQKYNYLALGVVGLLALVIGDYFTIASSLGIGNTLVLSSLIAPVYLLGAKMPFKKTFIALIFVAFFSVFKTTHVEVFYLLLIIPVVIGSCMLSKQPIQKRA